jgi:serine/threonine-protein kinase
MADELRVQQLLEEILERGRTPEEVCADDPALLKEVQARWAKVRCLEYHLDELFPNAAPPKSDSGTATPNTEGELPQIDGYKVESVLGRGGMGVVFKARQLKPNRSVALKMLQSGANAHPLELLRFRREVEAVALLRHPNIVQVYEVGEHSGRQYFSMELVEGGSLALKLNQALPTPRQAAELVATLAVTVQFAHQSGIIHRDLKPANILLTGQPGADGKPHAWGAPKIADFGLARFVHAGPELTLPGTRLGTPSYMAPEQALGKASDIGPAVDIYALGAILYESLTGHPPFEAPTAVETERRVIFEEPVPPSRLKAGVPRDVETICLKCLHKNPTRRYASAQDLADDLHRFLDGKPVRARPVGVAERTLKWARRRPAAALLVVVLLGLVVAATGLGVWLNQQKTEQQEAKFQRQKQARKDIGDALERLVPLRKNEQWRVAESALTEAATHLADADSPDLAKQLSRAQADIQLAIDLERVRESKPVRGGWDLDNERRATAYQELFNRWKLRISDVDSLVSTIQASDIREQIVAALDDWAYVAFLLEDAPLVERLLLIARRSDHDPVWRNRFRNREAWVSREKLRELTSDAFNIEPLPPGHQLALLGMLLNKKGSWSRATELLREACRRQPGNFWINRAMGDALRANGRWDEAIGYYRAALAVRPDNPGILESIGEMFLRLYQTEEAIAALRSAVKNAPPDHSSRGWLVNTLAEAGYWKEAEEECQQAQKVDPTNKFPPFRLAKACLAHHRYDEAITMFRKTLEIVPDDFSIHLNLGIIFTITNKHSEAAQAYRETLALQPTNYPLRRTLASELTRAGKPDEAIAELKLALVLQTMLALPPHPPFYEELGRLLRTQGRLEEALTALRKGTEFNLSLRSTLELIAAVQLELGNFAEARTATQRRLTLYLTDDERRAMNQQLALCNTLLAIQDKLPAILAGKELPGDAATQLALANWCFKYKRLTAKAASFYSTALGADPNLTSDLETANRFNAACAAALAGCGVGTDAASLGEQQRAALRRQALEWLTAEHKAWSEHHLAAKPGDRTRMATTVRTWLSNEDLARVRDERWLAALPPDERRDWQALWSQVGELAARDPLAKFTQGREHIDRMEWKQAAVCYAEGLELEPTDSSDLWFEFAAAQLLAKDLQGYRKTCAYMLARCQSAPMMRPYHVVRACTLAPDSVEDASRPSRLAGEELSRNKDTFWSLTEQGALKVRDKRFEEAIPLLEGSLRIDARPGRAVLNWLWLALAYQKSGQIDEARRWLAKATRWLDQQGGRMPTETVEMGSHRHNWLEAQALRVEVEQLLAPAH